MISANSSSIFISHRSFRSTRDWQIAFAHVELVRKLQVARESSFRERQRFRADWHAIRETLPIESCITDGVMARQRPHRKASISADLASLGFLLIISLIARFAELIGPVSRVQLRPRGPSTRNKSAIAPRGINTGCSK